MTTSFSSTIQGSDFEEGRRASIRYTEAVSLEHALRDVIRLCDFFTLNVGELICPRDVHVKIDDGSDSNYEVHAHFAPAERELDPKEARRCLLSPAFTPDEFSLAISRWFERESEWKTSYRLGTQAIASQNEVSRRRFLDAITWFESIPLCYDVDNISISKVDIQAASREADKVFCAGGYAVSSERIYNLLGTLNQPSLSSRLKAAASYLEVRFGSRAVPRMVHDSISDIVRIRGSYAHGGTPEVDFSYPRIYAAIISTEWLSMLLTLADLPWQFDFLDNSSGHMIHNHWRELSSSDTEV